MPNLVSNHYFRGKKQASISYGSLMLWTVSVSTHFQQHHGEEKEKKKTLLRSQDMTLELHRRAFRCWKRQREQASQRNIWASASEARSSSDLSLPPSQTRARISHNAPRWASSASHIISREGCIFFPDCLLLPSRSGTLKATRNLFCEAGWLPSCSNKHSQRKLRINGAFLHSRLKPKKKM